MTSALRWAAMRAILMFQKLWGTKSQDSVHKPQLLKRKESRSGIEPRSFRLPAFRLTYRPKRFSGGWFCPRTYRSMVLSERFGSGVALTGLHSARGLVNSLRGCAVVPAFHGRRLVARAAGEGRSRCQHGHDYLFAAGYKVWTI